jgi:hypothetical protein
VYEIGLLACRDESKSARSLHWRMPARKYLCYDAGQRGRSRGRWWPVEANRERAMGCDYCCCL